MHTQTEGHSSSALESRSLYGRSSSLAQCAGQGARGLPPRWLALRSPTPPLPRGTPGHRPAGPANYPGECRRTWPAWLGITPRRASKAAPSIPTLLNPMDLRTWRGGDSGIPSRGLGLCVCGGGSNWRTRDPPLGLRAPPPPLVLPVWPSSQGCERPPAHHPARPSAARQSSSGSAGRPQQQLHQPHRQRLPG